MNEQIELKEENSNQSKCHQNQNNCFLEESFLEGNLLTSNISNEQQKEFLPFLSSNRLDCRTIYQPLSDVEAQIAISALRKIFGIQNEEEIIFLSRLDIQRATKLNDEKISDLLYRVSVPLCSKISSKNALNLMLEEAEFSREKNQRNKRLSFGDPVIDCCLNGGFLIKGITEIVGESASGKTQFCLQLALQVQLPFSKGGLNGKALYISSEGHVPLLKRFRQLLVPFSRKYVEHISIEGKDITAGQSNSNCDGHCNSESTLFECRSGVSMLSSSNSNENLTKNGVLTTLSTGSIGVVPCGSNSHCENTNDFIKGHTTSLEEQLSNNVYVESVSTVEHLSELLYSRLPAMLRLWKEEVRHVRLVIIDSLAALLRVEFSAEEAPARSNFLFRLASHLRAISDQYEVPIVIVNQVSDHFNSKNNESNSGYGMVHIDENWTHPSKNTNRFVIPALGLAWSNCINTRLLLSRTEMAIKPEYYLQKSPRSLDDTTNVLTTVVHTSIECKQEKEEQCTKRRRLEDLHNHLYYSKEQEQYPLLMHRLDIVLAAHLPNRSCNFIITKSGIAGIE